MRSKSITIILFITCLTCIHGHSQLTDSSLARQDRRQFVRSLVIPVVLTTYGFIALGSDGLTSLDKHIKQEVWVEHPHGLNHLDDVLQYVPALSVYVLNGINVPGKNNLLDATRQYFISSIMMTIVVQSIKKITHLRRPDGSSRNTFPSGHTATAFVAAEFMNQEYKDRSPLYSVLGYTMASAVGYLRLYNNRHWFKDIVTGAGIGMGITKLVYHIYPSLKRSLFRDRPSNTMVMPFYENGVGGLSLVHTFQ